MRGRLLALPLAAIVGLFAVPSLTSATVLIDLSISFAYDVPSSPRAEISSIAELDSGTSIIVTSQVPNETRAHDRG